MKALLPLLCLLLAACAVGPYAETPRYKQAETRATAARQLNEALAFGARNISEVAADELRLTWHERKQLTDKRYVMLERQLNFNAVRSVMRPEKPGVWWELRIDASGGQITFEFDDGPTASKAEIALRRLMRELSEAERKELAEKYFRVLDGEADKAARLKNQHSPNEIDWPKVDTAIDHLKLITDKDVGDGVQGLLKWRDYLSDRFEFPRR